MFHPQFMHYFWHRGIIFMEKFFVQEEIIYPSNSLFHAVSMWAGERLKKMRGNWKLPAQSSSCFDQYPAI